jgi:hypothetical protein
MDAYFVLFKRMIFDRKMCAHSITHMVSILFGRDGGHLDTCLNPREAQLTTVA